MRREEVKGNAPLQSLFDGNRCMAQATALAVQPLQATTVCCKYFAWARRTTAVSNYACVMTSSHFKPGA
ncbi:protein of unknown function [Paraburkholderia kururiensis]